MIKHKISIQYLLLILTIIVFNVGCTGKTSTHLYTSPDLGINFKYPESWELREDAANHISLEYKEDESVKVGIYIRIDEMNFSEAKDVLEILQDQLDIWQSNNEDDNFVILQEPQKGEHNGNEMATTIALVNIPNEVSGFTDSLILTSNFYQETMVISHGSKAALIVILSREANKESPLSDEIKMIIDSFYFE